VLYVGVSDGAATRVMAFDVQPDGSIAAPRVFLDAQRLRAPGLRGGCDGLKVDREGNVWTTGPGGVLVVSREGRLLGRLNTHEPTANCAWGDDGSTLYITANYFVVRIRTLTRGAGW
jgi:gluconolactonase